MPRPVSQYCSLPFSRHCICSPPRCSPELCRMPADVHRRPGKERCGRAGAPTRQNSGAGRPGRLRQYPTHPAQAFGASRRSVSNSDTLFMRLPAGRPAGWSAGSRKVEESGGGKPSGRKPQVLPLHLRSTRAVPAALPQRPTAQNLPWGKNLVRRGACGLEQPGQNLFDRGECPQGTPRARPRMTCAARSRPKLAPFRFSAPLIFRSILPQFPRRFPAVARVA